MNLKSLLLSVGLFAPLCLHAQTYTPITAVGYNQDVIIGGAETAALGHTATLDGNNTGPTFYSVGYNAAAPTTGLPTGNFSVAALPGLNFTLQNAVGSNAVYNGGTLTLAGTTRYSSLAILGASGNSNSSTALTVTVTHANGAASETFGPGLAAVRDWCFQTTNIAVVANGRIDTTNGNFGNVNSGNPELSYSILALNDTVNPVTSVVINNLGATTNGGSGYSNAVFGISGVTVVPEPSTYVMLGASMLGGAMFLRRRLTGSAA